MINVEMGENHMGITRKWRYEDVVNTGHFTNPEKQSVKAKLWAFT